MSIGHGTGAQPTLLRTMNNRVVLDLLSHRGTLSRGEVHELTGLSKPTASQLLTRLEESGLVEQSGFGTAGPGGRAPQLYRLNPAAGFAAGVDVRSDSIAVRIADITGCVVAECTAPSSPNAHHPADVARMLGTCATSAGVDPARIEATVIALPGSYDVDADRVRFVDHLPHWRKTGLLAGLRAEIPGGSVTIENDVNLVARAELAAATPADGDDFYLHWLDEGIGGALAVGGRILRGSRGAAGEAAFLVPPGASLDANSRAEGPLEVLAGGDALIRIAREHGHDVSDVKDAAIALRDDTSAQGTVDALVHSHVLALASVVALIDPARIVLAGTVSRIGGERLRTLVADMLGSVVHEAPPITLGNVVDQPVLVGALLLGIERARDRVFAT